MRHMNFMRSLLCCTALMMPLVSHAQVTQEDINGVVAAMQAEPNNLDYVYQYAKMAEEIGQYDKAIEAYKYMLRINPRLDRVRLDLSLVYLKQQHVREARNEMQRVLWNDPPPEVKKTISKLLGQVPPDDTEPNQWSGFVVAGINNDSNANSAPGSGNVTVLDTTVPLSSSSTGREDRSTYVAAGVDHQYISPNNVAGVRPGWRTSVQAYESTQHEQDQLDIQLAGVKTGPQVLIPGWNALAVMTGGVTYVTLDSNPYLWIYGVDASVEKSVGPRISLVPAFGYEQRSYRNSPTVSTYSDRDGPAYQFGLTGRYLLTENDMVDAVGLLRREYTRQDYYDNDQYQISAGYTHLFADGYFANGRAGYKYSGYDGPDFLISSATRVDQETFGTVTAGVNFSNNMSLSATYYYRDVGSNIINYDYTNHRFGASLGWKF